MRRMLTVWGCVVLSACAQSAPSPVVNVMKPSGSLQCAASQTTQVNLDRVVRSLQTAGAVVRMAQCANDGKMRMTVCGADRGDVWWLSVSEASLKIAQGQGFTVVKEAASLVPQPCD